MKKIIIITGGRRGNYHKRRTYKRYGKRYGVRRY